MSDVRVKTLGDEQARILLRGDGILEMGPGGSTAPSAVIDASGTQTRIKAAGPRVILTDSVQAGNNADTNADTLVTFTVPAATCTVTGDLIEVVATGTFGATGNNKTLLLQVDGNTLNNTGTVTHNGLRWFLRAYIIRTGATTADQVGETTVHGNNMGNVDANTNAVTWANALAITIVGNSPTTGAANDVVYDHGFVRFWPLES